jgi:hypothetical protein
MKQIYALSLALLAVSATALSAEATTNVNFVCPDHSEAVQVVTQYYDWDIFKYVDAETYTFDAEGKVTVSFDVDAYEYQRFLVNVDSDSEYIIKSMTSDNSSLSPQKNGSLYSYKIDSYLEEDVDDVTITINLVSEGELYSDKLYLTVDNPSIAKISLYNESEWSTRSIDVSGFEAGVETPVLFNAAAESTLYIRTNDYDSEVYKVVKNGETVTLDGVALDVAADDHIEVFYNWPDVSVLVNIIYRTEESKGCITGVTVNDEPVENFDEGFEVKIGSYLSIDGDEDLYNYTYLAINDDVDDYISFPNTIKVTEATTITVEAHPYRMLNYTVNIDDPNNIIFYAGYNNKVTLVEGANELTISELSPTVTIKPKDSLCMIKSIVDAEGNSLYTPSSYTNYASIKVTDGMVINITTAVIVRDKEFVLYFDDPDGAEYGQSLERADGSALVKSGYYDEGYTKFAFGDDDNDFVFTFYGVGDDDPNNVYINDIKQSPEEDTTANYTLTLADKDVVKLFFGSNPEFYNVSFDVPEDVELSVVKDLITEASVDGFQVLTGTQVDLTVSTEKGYDLYVNGEKVEVEENAYSFNVTADTVVKVEVATENGVSAISAESLRGNVYNLQGISVGTDLNRLPAGIYIINGRKIAVK